jgi:FtsP/CotA-like multicopper oxidase with cupredoxin domain
MDGVAGVTQEPVPPNGSFVYEFVPKDAGTFWFHPHIRSSEQVERGLFGVLVVEDREPPPYARDVVWVVDDWRLGPGRRDRPELQHAARPRPRRPLGERRHGERPDGARAGGAAGRALRLRLVNTANGRVFRLDWGGLDARIIAVDGMYAREPVDPAGFELSPGNRIDLDVRVPARRQAAGW